MDVDTRTPQARAILARHGLKSTRLDIQSIEPYERDWKPGGEDDRTRVHLIRGSRVGMDDPESVPGTAENLAMQGRSALPDERYGASLAHISHFVRNRESLLSLTEHVQRDEPLRIHEMPELSYIRPGQDPEHEAHPDLPCVDDEEVNRQRLMHIVEHYTFRREDDPEEKMPLVSLLGKNFFGSLARGLEDLREERTDLPSLYLNITHGMVVDTLLQHSSGAVEYDLEKGRVRIDEERFPYQSRMGELFTADIHDLDTEDPLLVVRFGPRRGDRKYRLSDLRRIEREYRMMAERDPVSQPL